MGEESQRLPAVEGGPNTNGTGEVNTVRGGRRRSSSDSDPFLWEGLLLVKESIKK